MTTFVLCNECGNRWKVSLSLSFASVTQTFCTFLNNLKILFSFVFSFLFSVLLMPSGWNHIFFSGDVELHIFYNGRGEGVYKLLQLVIKTDISVLTVFTWNFEICKHVLIIRGLLCMELKTEHEHQFDDCWNNEWWPRCCHDGDHPVHMLCEITAVNFLYIWSK